VAVPVAPPLPGVPPPTTDVDVAVGAGVGVLVAVPVAPGVPVVVAVAVGVAVTVGDGVEVGVAIAANPDGPNDATEKLLMTRSAGPAVAVGVGVAVGAAAVSAANTVKCDDSPVTVPAPGLTDEPPATGCQLPLAVSKKNTPAGGEPVNARVICTGCAKVLTATPLASLAVRSTALLTSCCPPLSAGALVRAICTLVFWVTAPGGKTTRALPSGSCTEPPPEPTTPAETFGSGEFELAARAVVAAGAGAAVGAGPPGGAAPATDCAAAACAATAPPPVGGAGGGGGTA
jgi:hypothetical protein